ncbi:conserved hypothetical protein [Theileria orientalis strain Shintoku]|uniref:Uncharacterized protein n=1 Tax=Theileria orientalis strain Shintoku TaxID=869250 RepID=J7M4I3_THEOR|nr:conserved hypothetical protein [Theileria orientalis strain Shintoku]PVC50291.1 hypothetical protein MACL_00002345 [Theileria orientalis]BAM38585.1 conserved hypothetical protein [Theileria orientalis strain Shintoku]|eukprot:XP_009688886.1 conserved hypothetical protein [Theileria orientalis strain Shintoku]
MYVVATLRAILCLVFVNVVICVRFESKFDSKDGCKLKFCSNSLFFVNCLKNLSQLGGACCRLKYNGKTAFYRSRAPLNSSEHDDKGSDGDLDRILIGLENPQDIRGPYISPDGMVVNKKKMLYSTGELCHVDDFFEGKFRVEWTVRGVKEVWRVFVTFFQKLQYRYRDTHTLPLSTSRFTLAGIKGFVLRLWLDGHRGSEKGHIAMSLVQQEHWSSLDSPICLFAGKVVRGPFFYRSPDYFKAAKSLCRLEDVLENNTIRLGVMIATRDDSNVNS